MKALSEVSNLQSESSQSADRCEEFMLAVKTAA